MSNRRGKSQARRHGAANGGLPGWAWLVLGVMLTLLAVLLVPRLLRGDGEGFLRPRANPDALPATVAEGDAIAADTAPAGQPARPAAARPDEDKPNYDFYTLLPGEEVAMSDAELAASARAEAEAQQRAAAAAAAAAASGSTPTLPDPVDLSTPASTPAATAAAPAPAAPQPSSPVASTPATTASAPAAAAPTPSAAPAQADDARYILQAGAFGASGDAEAVKARIALLGLNARVESAQIQGKTVYRVRMGPYGTASELADAKSKLANGGLQAMAVRAK